MRYAHRTILGLLLGTGFMALPALPSGADAAAGWHQVARSASIHLSEPWSLAATPRGEVYIADRLNYRIVHLSTTGRMLGAWGGFIHREYDAGPMGVALDRAGNVYATDPAGGRILKFSPWASCSRRGGGRVPARESS